MSDNLPVPLEHDLPAAEEESNLDAETVEALTTHFRRTTRARVVELPRWAQ